MPFAIREHGERSKLISHLETVKETGADGKEVKDQSQLKAAIGLAKAEINSLPKEFNSALVIIEGRATDTKREIIVQVVGQNAHV